MGQRVTRMGNSWGLILPRKVLELLEINKVDTEAVSNARFVAAPSADLADIQATLVYLTSKREREGLYQELAE
ncbi:MAG: hypothetical protein ACRDJI_11295 [Actinomycetota bacterium]